MASLRYLKLSIWGDKISWNKYLRQFCKVNPSAPRLHLLSLKMQLDAGSEPTLRFAYCCMPPHTAPRRTVAWGHGGLKVVFPHRNAYEATVQSEQVLKNEGWKKRRRRTQWNRDLMPKIFYMYFLSRFRTWICDSCMHSQTKRHLLSHSSRDTRVYARTSAMLKNVSHERMQQETILFPHITTCPENNSSVCLLDISSRAHVNRNHHTSDVYVGL